MDLVVVVVFPVVPLWVRYEVGGMEVEGLSRLVLSTRGSPVGGTDERRPIRAG